MRPAVHFQMKAVVDDEDEARRMVGSWFQISRAYRTVARLPPGETGVEALARAARHDDCDSVSWAHCLGEYHAGDHYLRCYAGSENNVTTMTPGAFAAYRKAGGGPYP